MNVKKFTEASVLSAAFVIISVVIIALGGGQLGYIDFIVPALAGIILLKCGLKYSILSCISSVLLLIMMVGDPFSAVMTAQSMILGITAAYFMRKDENIFDDFFYTSIAGIIIILLMDYTFSAFIGYSLLKDAKETAEQAMLIMNPMINALAAASNTDPAVLTASMVSMQKYVVYLSIAVIPIGTVILTYVLLIFLSKKLRITDTVTAKKRHLLKNLKKTASLLTLSRKNLYIGTCYCVITAIINNFIIKNEFSYAAIFLNSSMYVILFYLFQDSWTGVGKFLAAVVKKPIIMTLYNLAVILFLINFPFILTAVLISANLLIDVKFNLKSVINNCVKQMQ